MSKRKSTVERTPVGGEDFMETLNEKALEGNWLHVIGMSAVGLKEKFVENGEQLNVEDTGTLELLIQFFLVIHGVSTKQLVRK